MKILAILGVIAFTTVQSRAETNILEKFSPRFSTNTPIIWQAPANHVPKAIWVYQRGAPRIFPEAVISNAFALVSLRGKKIPQPSASDFIIMDDKPANYLGPICNIFRISPSNGSVSYTMPDPVRGSTKDIPGDETIVARAWKYVPQLGLDPKQLEQRQLASQSCDFDENGREATNHICGRGVYLARLLDGIPFWGDGADPGTGGFWIEFGSRGKIRCFTLTWPNLERYENRPTASSEQIIFCIRAQRIIVIPDGDERYFGRVKALANAKKFTITRITPCYGEGVFGEMPAYDELPKYFTPLAELEAVADFGNSNMTVRIVCPVLLSDVTRLLAVKTK